MLSRLIVFVMLFVVVTVAFFSFRSLFSTTTIDTNNGQEKTEHSSLLRSKFHNMVDKYELVGYGPAHPRAAFILVATQDLSDPVASMTRSISSILNTTDRNRILVICAVFERGVLNDEEEELVKEQLQALDAGTSDHWHGTTQHSHGSDSTSSHEHGSKIQFMPLDHQSVSASRRDAVRYIEYLIENYQGADLKSPQERILSVFVRPDAEFMTNRWIDTAAHALLGSSTSSSTAAASISTATDAKEEKTLNAISFASSSTETISQGETKSLNLEMKPMKSHVSNSALGLTQGQSYPTPIVDGAVTIMALDTFQNLPVSDLQLDSHFASDVEMSFNLWMCADGIDIVTSLRAKTTLGLLQHKDKAGMSPASAARLAYTWMGGKDNDIGELLLHGLDKSGVTVDHLEKARKLENLPNVKGLLQSCRSFDWYANEVNVAMGKERNLKLESRQKNGLESDHGKISKGGHLAPEYEMKQHNRQKEVLPPKEEDPVLEHEQVVGRLPTKPLSAINQEIISTAKMVDLTYVDVTDGYREHPHRGAMDEHGNFGYVHDEKALRLNSPPFEYTDEQIQCDNNDGNKKMLTKKVFVDIPAHEAAERKAETSGKPRAKIFCLVYTIEKFHDRIPTIRQTWGQKCDGFMVGSTKTDRELGTVNIPHEGKEEYDNIWQKVRSMWSYIYDNYYEEYDWFHIGGDDLYLIVENLRLYLESEEIQLAANGGKYLPTGNETKQLPLFLGRRFKEQGNEKRMFNSGGSGYTMNKAALKALIVDAFPTCMPHLRTFAEDVMVAQCFRNKLGVYPFDTKDENGGERYMPFTPKHHLNYRIPSDVKSDWYSNYSIDIKEGLDHCSSESVAFHYIKGDLMKRMHAILYGYCT